MSRARTPLALAAAAGAVLALAGCAGGSVDTGSASSSGASTAASGGASTAASGGASSTAAAGTVVVGGADFTEMQVMQQMYVQLLQHAGYKTSTVTVSNRELYYPQLTSGAISVVPEYAATLAEYLNAAKNGQGAKAIATNDASATVSAAQPLANATGVTLLQPAKAADQNAFAVTTDYAKANGGLTTLSQLGATGKTVVLAGTEECPQRPFCVPGLENTYGIKISNTVPLGFDTAAVKQSVQKGESQLGLVATTDGTLSQFGLTVLDDDKHLQLADNLVPAVNSSVAKDTKLTGALDSLSDVLTTQDLAQLNAEVDGQRMLPADVAKQYLQSKGLLS